jgi:CDP-4-dehydro-6-deoxyglucose reductase, E3
LQEKVYLIKELSTLTPNVVKIVLSPESEPMSYQAGQYIKVLLPDYSVAPLSVANAPHVNTNSLEFHLLFTSENFKAINILQQAKQQKKLIINGPYGDCTVDRLSSKPIIFLARGTGFAPIKSVIEALLQQEQYPAMHLYWSVPGWRDIYMHDLVENWVKNLKDFRFTAVLTRETPQHPGIKFGKIPEVVLQDYPDLSSFQAYASGPEAMVYAALNGFKLHGLRQEDFYSDVFNYVV